MSDEEDVYICDECDDIFLSKSGLATHVKEAHEAKDVVQKTEAVAAVKRSRSPSREGSEHEVKKKKVKMGPASRVKRDRESSEENEGPSINNELVSNLLDKLASTESEGDKEKGREKEREKHKKHKKDRERDRDRDRDKESHREKSKKHKDRDKDRDRERDKERNKERDRASEKEKKRDKVASRASGDSSDDEERNRRRAEKAKAEWKRKDDILKGKDSKYKSNGMHGFIVDDDDQNANKSKKIRDRDRDRPEKSSAGSGGGFASQGTVKTHDNELGPECFKCGQICKDNSNLKNHVLSHYYQVFYEVLPDSKPYPCPDCDSKSRDRITLVRHYAFTHKKLFEMTDVTPELIAGFGNRKSTVKKKESVPMPISSGAKRSQNGDKVRKIDYSKIIDSDSEEEDVENKIKRMQSKYLKITDGETRNDQGGEGEGRKEHKKHKKHKHKDHKHKKEKKHKHKDRDRDREERDGASQVHQGGPLGSLLKDLSPDSSASSRSQSQARPEGERPETPSDQAVNKNGNPTNEEPAEDSDDLLDDDFATPVFA